jgi:putative protein kinase ArgK-like GTPase of G3E family
VLAASAHTGDGVGKVLQAVEEYRAALEGSGELAEVRARCEGTCHFSVACRCSSPAAIICLWPCGVQLRKVQRRKLAWTATEEAVLEGLRGEERVRALFEQLLPEVGSGALPPRAAAERLAACFTQQQRPM